MTPGIPIYGKEGQELEKTISKLIGRHNVLCDVEKAFSADTISYLPNGIGIKAGTDSVTITKTF